MNGVLDSQTSGNDWSRPSPEMIFQDYQGPVASAVPPNRQRSIFHDFEQQMAQFEANHQAVLTEVQKSYVIPKDSPVRDFFKSHRTIPQLLTQAAPRLKEYFGVGTVFSLRTQVDEYGSQTLYAVVRWPGDVHAVRAALENFDDHWWIANSRQAAGDLTFTYELV